MAFSNRLALPLLLSLLIQVSLLRVPATSRADEASQTTPDATAQQADPKDEASAASADSEKADSEKADSEKADSEKADSEKADSEKADSEKADSEKADSEKADSEKKAASKDADSAKQAASDDKEDGKEDGKEEKQADAKQVHLLPLRGSYVDFPQSLGLDPTSLLLGGAMTKQKSFHRLSEYLDNLRKDEKTQVIVLDLSDSSLSMNVALLNEFSRRMAKLRDAGKKTIAWLEDASNVQLVLAAQCDEVVMADFGGIDMPSLAMESMYFRDAMDLLGIKASVVRAGDYKGAVEPYTESKMSSHLREHYVAMLESINATLVDSIARGRGLTVEQVRKLQGRRILTPKAALEAGLVDRLAPYGSMKSAVETIAGAPMKWTSPAEKVKKEVSFFELMGMLMAGPKTSATSIREPSIAVLHLSGAIVDGKKESSGSIVDGPTVRDIKKLAEDKNVKAVVVRINSPGGSASASESVRQALLQLAKSKPTVVSMGEVAASGGYWISCIGVPVYAEPGTITGSIGVFSMKLSLGTLLRRVGVHVESITLDESAAAFSLDRAWTEEEEEALGQMVDEVYNRFLGLVAESRSMKVEEIKPLAGGRVWSGVQAKERRLVDRIGGVDDCIDFVAKQAKLNDYKVIHRPVAKSGLEILDLLGGGEDDEIRSALSMNLVKTMQARGFSLAPTLAILKDSLQSPQRRPRVWALQPMELRIR